MSVHRCRRCSMLVCLFLTFCLRREHSVQADREKLVSDGLPRPSSRSMLETCGPAKSAAGKDRDPERAGFADASDRAQRPRGRSRATSKESWAELS